MVALYESQSAQVPDSGSVGIYLPVKRAGISWRIRRMIVSCTGTKQPPPTIEIYRNVATPSTLLDSAYDASQNSSDTDIALGSGEQLLAQFDGAQPGSYCTITVTGELNVF